jgi:hypothetical protein
MSDSWQLARRWSSSTSPTKGAPFVQGFGGDTSNLMIAAARLGATRAAWRRGGASVDHDLAEAAYFTAVGAPTG